MYLVTEKMQPAISGFFKFCKFMKNTSVAVPHDFDVREVM